MNCLSFKFRGHRYSIRVSEFNGHLSLGYDDWMLGDFRSVDKLISHIEEQARWTEGAIRAPRLSKRAVTRIEDFVRKFPNTWLGN